MHLLVVGQRYETDCSNQEVGARVDMLTENGNVLQVFIPEIAPVEVNIVLTGTVTCGILVKNSAIHLVWCFKKDGLAPMMFETPFDVRVIKEKHYFDITDPEHRPLFTIHLVESDSQILKGLRAITMHKELAIKLMSAIQDQAASAKDSMPQTEQWMSNSVETLFAMSDKYVMGQ